MEFKVFNFFGKNTENCGKESEALDNLTQPEDKKENSSVETVDYVNFDLPDTLELYNALKDGTGETLILSKKLPKPLDKIELFVSNPGGNILSTLSLKASLSTDEIIENFGGEEAVKTISDHYVKMNKNNIFSFNSENGACLVMNTGLTDILISNGETKYTTEPYIKLPELSMENIDIHIKAITEVTKKLINSIYVQQESKPEIQELKITVPKKMAKLAIKSTFYSIDDDESEKSLLLEKDNGITFSEIGGQKKAKEELKKLSAGISNPKTYTEYGILPPKGMLLYGPPGTGKTLLARALATDSKAEFRSISVSDIVSMWYGASERRIQSIFDDASKSTDKSIIFIDEIDSLASDRSKTHEASQRILSTILTCMDGAKANDRVFVLASTNRKESLDSAILRPGRFSKHIEVDLPDAEDRKEIIDVHINKAIKISGNSKLFDKVDTDKISKETDKCSGADLAEIVRRTLEIKAHTKIENKNPGPVTTEDILDQVEKYEHLATKK